MASRDSIGSRGSSSAAMTAVDDLGLGQRLRAARLARGMTQGELAAPDYSIGYISRIESGTRQPSDSVLSALASRLQVSVGHLRNGDDASQAAPASHEELDLAELSLASGDAQEALRRTVALLDSGALRHSPDLERQARFIHARCQESLGDPHASIIELEDLLKVTPHGEFAATVGIALTRCYVETEDYATAIKHGERILAVLDRRGLHRSDAYIRLMVTVAAAHMDSDQLGVATRLLRRAMALAEAADSSSGVGAAAWNAGAVAELRGDMAQATQHTHRALDLLEDVESLRNVARLRNRLAYYLALDPEADLDEARTLAEQAARELECSSASPVNLARNLLVRARIALRQGQAGRARDLLAEIAPTACLDDSALAGEIRVLQTAALVDAGEMIDAAYDDATILLSLIGRTRYSAQLWFELGDIASAAGERQRAAHCYRTAAICFGANETALLTRRPQLAAPASDLR